MISKRFSASLLLAVGVLWGCKKKEAEKAPEPEAPKVVAGSGSAEAPAPTPPPAPPPAAAAAPDLGAGGEAKNAALVAIPLPPPKGAPAAGKWVDVQNDEDGNRKATWVVEAAGKKEYWAGVRFIDCRRPLMKEYESKPADQRGELGFCFDAPTDKLKDHGMFKPNNMMRVVRPNHIAVLATIGVTGQGKLKAEDLEAWLETLDLAAIAKL